MANYCIICFKVEERNGESENNVELQRKYFKFLKRYLSGGGGDDGRGYQTNFLFEQAINSGMVCCGQCHERMEAFCDLYNQLRIIELRLNWEVELLKSSLEFGGDEGIVESINVDGQRWYGEGNVLELVRNWRKRVGAKCENQLKRSLPKVSIPIPVNKPNGDVSSSDSDDPYDEDFNEDMEEVEISDDDVQNLSEPIPIQSTSSRRKIKDEEAMETPLFDLEKYSAHLNDTQQQSDQSDSNFFLQMLTPTEAMKPKRASSQARAPKAYKCKLCPFKTLKLYQLEGHLRNHETSFKPFNCNLCKANFTTEQYHSLHLARHRGLHKIPCDACPRFFTCFELENHLRTTHEAVVIFSCPKCSFYFSNNENLKNHVATHSQKEVVRGPYVPHNICKFPGCLKSFLTQDGLRKHEEKHEKKYKCTKCPQTFSTLMNLETHQNYHDLGLLDPFKCSKCDSSYKTKAELQDHQINSHSYKEPSAIPSGKVLRCTYCFQRFKSYSVLRAHRKEKHQDLKRKLCKLCMKQFLVDKFDNHDCVPCPEPPILVLKPTRD